MDATVFLAKVRQALGGRDVEDLPDDDVIALMSVSQYVTDLLLVAAEDRDLIRFHEGVLGIPFELPEGIEPIETILTRPPDLDDVGGGRDGLN